MKLKFGIIFGHIFLYILLGIQNEIEIQILFNYAQYPTSTTYIRAVLFQFAPLTATIFGASPYYTKSMLYAMCRNKAPELSLEY
jgi:hypothetical protein